MSEQRPVNVRVRRTPRFGVFLTVGGLAGVLAAMIAVSSGSGGQDYTAFTSISYFAVVFVVGGVALGAVAALIVDWSFRRRTSETRVTGTYAADEPDAGDAPESDAAEEPDAAGEPEEPGDGPEPAGGRESDGSGDGHMSMGH